MRTELIAFAGSHIVTDLGLGLREAFNMFWATLWALILGFGLSGVVQAFVSRDEMQTRLGNHRPTSVGRASFYGMISSSCSYAASAMTKSLFLRGADFIAAMVFMFASTNLVIELGIVLIILIGWQFAVAEFIGGTIMIVLLVGAGGLWFRGRVLDGARRNVERGQSSHTLPLADPDLQQLPWRQRIRSAGGWSDAAGYTMSDLTMLKKELFIGFVVAGFLAALVPVQVWNVVFFHGHGSVTTLENVVVGPFIALISFVCSVGNVPLAAALWKGGISFGGVVSFIFADLISLPLLLIYRKFYGGRMTLRMLAVFWLVMSLAGLITEGIFRIFGGVPTIRPTVIASNAFGFNYTTILDFIFLLIFGGLYWLYRNRERFGGGAGYAKDVVCGMQVEIAHAPASTNFENNTYFFCSNRCNDRFVSSPERYIADNESDAVATIDTDHGLDHQDNSAIDPVCGMTIEKASAADHQSYAQHDYWFCSAGCSQSFHTDPERYIVKIGEPGNL